MLQSVLKTINYYKRGTGLRGTFYYLKLEMICCPIIRGFFMVALESDFKGV